jgi:NADPH:quinone reductase-like Zn-dependent oxidoreductase
MRAFLYDRYGPASVVHQAEVPAPVPRAGEVRVAVHAAALNPIDTKLRGGALRFLPMSRVPMIFGHDVAGVVEGCGPAVTGIETGEPVFGFTKGMTGGALADFVTLPADDVVPIPDKLSFGAAAAVPLCATTAMQALRGFRRGAKVLVNGASGGVGSLAVQIAAAWGGQVTGVCSWKNADLVRSFGVTDIRDYLREPVLRSDDRFDVIFDTQSNLPAWHLLSALAPGGRYVDVLPSVSRTLAGLIAPLRGRRFSMVAAKPSGKDLAEVAGMIAAGTVTPFVEKVYTVDQLSEAQVHLEGGHTRGKLVIQWPAIPAP